MAPLQPLPMSDEFSSASRYVDELLGFATTSDIFQTLCGGVHILDFFTSEPALFSTILPADWQAFLLRTETMVLLDILMREDLGSVMSRYEQLPESLLEYVRDIRRLSLDRSFTPRRHKLSTLSREKAFGMKPKKKHEVVNFAGYVDDLAEKVAEVSGKSVTHFVDFGSGQNYLGRTLASPPYNRHIVAVESKESNMIGAKDLDMLSGIAEKQKVMRNKRVYQKLLASVDPSLHKDAEALIRAAKALNFTPEEIATLDLRRRKEFEAIYTPQEGKGTIHYVVGRLENADLTDVLRQVPTPEEQDHSLMAVSIHSCGNLSHYGIRSLVHNPAIQAVAIVGCCYNLLTEKLGPPTYKHPYLRPSLQPLNGRVMRESERRDPQGFPMSERLSTYGDHGVRLNITARMMACQAPANWTEEETDGFLTRHFYRAVLQKIFFDKGVVSKVSHATEGESEQDGEGSAGESQFHASTNPIIIGSLRKPCYASLQAYVRGAITKLTTNADLAQYNAIVAEKMGDMTDEEIEDYAKKYQPRKRELSAVWSLMAFSATVVESLIVTDRWVFLTEHPDVVRECWVETVFDYKESPRNLVVVGIKR